MISYCRDSVVKDCGADYQARWLATILGRGDKSFTTMEITFSVNVSAAFLQMLGQPANHYLLGVFRMYISKIWCGNDLSTPPPQKKNPFTWFFSATPDPCSPSFPYQLYLYSIFPPQSSMHGYRLLNLKTYNNPVKSVQLRENNTCQGYPLMAK